MGEIGREVREKRENERKRRYEKAIQGTIEEAWSRHADLEYGRAVWAGLRAYFLLDGSDYSVWLFLDGIECETEAFAALRGLIQSFEEVCSRDGFRVDRDGTVVDPLEVVEEFPGIGEAVWREFSEASTGTHSVDRLWLALSMIETVAFRRDLVEEITEPVFTIGEDFEQSPLHELFEKRNEQNRSLQVIIVARDNDTGTGKTTLGVHLCKLWAEDWSADNATNEPWQYREFLNNKSEGSVLLADEIGQMYDARRSMSEKNVAVSQDWQMIRTKEYKTISTLPGPSFLDKRLKTLADVMIVCVRRGHARVYRMKVDDASGDLWRDHLCNVEWGPLDDDPDYQDIEEMKRDRLARRFEDQDGQDDREDQEPSEEMKREVRDELIRDLADGDLPQSQIAEALGLSPSTVSKIVNNQT